MRSTALDQLKTLWRKLAPRGTSSGFRDCEGDYRIRYREKVVGGSTYFLPLFALHRPAVKRILADHLYEPQTHDLINAIFAQNKGSMIHAGAFFGDMLPSFSAAVDGVVWAFEPVTESYILANKCLTRNALPNVRLFNAALSDNVGMTVMDTGTYRRNGRGGHRGGASFIGETGTPAPTVMIDLFDFDALQVIHLDVEGHELAALSGAEATINQHAPIILVEDNNRDCNAFLAERGYRQQGETRELRIWTHERRADHKGTISEWLAR